MTISRKMHKATQLLLQIVLGNGSQVAYRQMTGSSPLLLRLPRKVVRPEGALPSNHLEGLKDLPLTFPLGHVLLTSDRFIGSIAVIKNDDRNA